MSQHILFKSSPRTRDIHFCCQSFGTKTCFKDINKRGAKRVLTSYVTVSVREYRWYAPSTTKNMFVLSTINTMKRMKTVHVNKVFGLWYKAKTTHEFNIVVLKSCCKYKQADRYIHAVFMYTPKKMERFSLGYVRRCCQFIGCESDILCPRDRRSGGILFLFCRSFCHSVTVILSSLKL